MTETEAAILKKWEDTYEEEYCIGSEEAEGEFWEAEWKEMMKRDAPKLKAADRKPPVRALRDNRRISQSGPKIVRKRPVKQAPEPMTRKFA